MFDQWTLKKKLLLTFAAILVISGSLIGFALVNMHKLMDTVGWNTHTYKVMREADAMLLNMVNIETGLRGFVASGDEKFLEPFNQGQKSFVAAFDQVKSLTSDNPAQQARLEKLMANHKQFLEVANALKAMRQDATAGKVSVDDLLKDFEAGKMSWFDYWHHKEWLLYVSIPLMSREPITTRYISPGDIAPHIIERFKEFGNQGPYELKRQILELGWEYASWDGSLIKTRFACRTKEIVIFPSNILTPYTLTRPAP